MESIRYDRKSVNSLNSDNFVEQGDLDTEKTVEVLYQKMGDRWFAFSLIDDEIFIGSITQRDIDCSRPRPSSCSNRKIHPDWYEIES